MTASSKKEAVSISEHLLKKKLIACANIFPPINSIYKWKGKVERAKEVAFILKTKKSLLKKLTGEIKKIHSYECPCILSFDMKPGNKDYARWLHKQF